MRVEARETLGRFGIGSNPGFTDDNIIKRLGSALKTNLEEVVDTGVENSEYAGEIFRDSLGELLGLEILTTCDDVVESLKKLN